jgi:hypothetical protein
MPVVLRRLWLVVVLACGALGSSCDADPVGDARIDADVDDAADAQADADEPQVPPGPSSWVWDLYGSGARRYANAVAEAEDGGVYVGGFDETFWGWLGRYDASGAERWALLLQPWIGDLAPHLEGGVVAVGHDRDGAFVSRFGPNGDRLWTLGWPGERPWPSSVDAIRATAEGTFLIAGTLSVSTEVARLWLAELDGDGEPLWQRTLADGEGRDASISLARDDDILLAFRAEDAVWLARLDRSGAPRWARRGAASGAGGFYSLEVVETTDGDVVLVATLAAGAVVVRLDGAGGLRWERVFGTDGDVLSTVALPGPDGSVIVGGTRIRDRDGFDPDLWLAGVDPDGESTWQRVLARPGCDVAHDAVMARDGNVIVATGGCEHALVVKLHADGSFDGGCDSFEPIDVASAVRSVALEELELAPEDTHVVPSSRADPDDMLTSSSLEVVCEGWAGE